MLLLGLQALSGMLESIWYIGLLLLFSSVWLTRCLQGVILASLSIVSLQVFSTCGTANAHKTNNYYEGGVMKTLREQKSPEAPV